MATSKKKGYLLVGVLLIVVIPLFFIFNPNGQFFFPKCPIHQHMGIYCSGCGSQRALHDLLHFRIVESLSHNLLFIPGLLLIGTELAMRLFSPKKTSLFYRKLTPWVVLIVIVLFMVLRNLKYWPFHHLAP